MAFKDMAYGPLGAAVEAAMPHTEADPIGVYASTLALWSSAVNGHVVMSNGRPVVVWTVLVGRSALGRKGYALRTAGAVLNPSIGDFLDLRTRSSVSSGPSLVNMLYELEQDTMASEAGADGRTLIVEEEWAGVLKRSRACKTFSQQLRTAWDGAPISNRTKESYELVERPLLGFHSHITPGEWAKYISSSDALGGSYNRMLPVLVERSQMLPYNHRAKIEESEALSEAYDWAKARKRTMEFAPDAGRRYDELRGIIEDKISRMPEFMSCYFERSAEQVTRVAAVLTAAEKKTKISKTAVDAAWAFVQYSMVSVEKLINDSAATPGKVLKPVPDLIREKLEQYAGEATRTLMLRALGTRVTADSLIRHVERMPDVEMIERPSESGKGRPAVVFRLIKEGEEACPDGGKQVAGVKESVPAEPPVIRSRATQKPVRRPAQKKTSKPRGEKKAPSKPSKSSNPFLAAL